MIYLSILFLVFFMPCALGAWCLCNKNKYLVPVVISGFVTGVIVSIAVSIFGSTYRLTEFSIGSNFSYIFMIYYFLPCLILYGVFFFLTKDSVDFKLKCFFPLTASFYVSFLPYMTVSSTIGRLLSFNLFYKPILCAAMLLLCSIYISKAVVMFRNKNWMWASVYTLVVIAALVVPSLLEAFWILGGKVFVVYLFCIVYIVLSLASLLLPMMLNKDEEK